MVKKIDAFKNSKDETIREPNEPPNLLSYKSSTEIFKVSKTKPPKSLVRQIFPFDPMHFPVIDNPLHQNFAHD